MKSLIKNIVCAAAICAGVSVQVQALPMFEGQSGFDCTACHNQQQPSLGKIGRDFALGGMTLTQKYSTTDEQIQDVGISLMMKSRYEKTHGKPNAQGIATDAVDTNDGILSVPRTASFIAGGRLGENAGALVRTSYKDRENNSFDGKIVFVKPLETGYLGTALYSTASFGPFAGMEVYNTGLYKPVRAFEIMKYANASQAAKVGTGEATGFQVYYSQYSAFTHGDQVFATVGMTSPAQDNSNMDVRDNFIPFARLAYEYPIGNFNFIVGGFAIGGGSTSYSNGDTVVDRETYGADIQIEGIIAQKNVTFSAVKIFKNEVTYTGINADDEDLEDVLNRAFSVDAQVDITSNLSTKLAYLEYNDMYLKPDEGHEYIEKHKDVYDVDRAITFGFDYSFKYYLPMKVSVEHSWIVPTLDRIDNYRDFVVTLNILF